MARRFVYKFELSDRSSGIWITDVVPPKAGYTLADRFPGRKVVAIERQK